MKCIIICSKINCKFKKYEKEIPDFTPSIGDYHFLQ